MLRTFSRSVALALALMSSLALATGPGERKSPTQEYLKPPESHTTQPNLVANGDFEKTVRGAGDAGGAAAGGKLMAANWGQFGTDQTKGAGIAVIDAGAPHGKVLRLVANEKQATSTGIFAYSDAIPVTVGHTYDITMEIQTDGIGVIVFVKGYGVVEGGTFAGRERELYRHKKEALLQKGQWMPFVSYFTPAQAAGQEVRARRGVPEPKVTQVRVEVYIYGGAAGTADFDNVRVTERPQAETAAAADAAKPKPQGEGAKRDGAGQGQKSGETATEADRKYHE